ncbi:glycosyltransferase [archaeon]|nr:glycosyltransferase [archaeon]
MSTGLKTKILYVITKSNFGGAQRYVFDVATRLPKDEFDVIVALGGTGERGAQTGTLRTMLQQAGVRTIVLKHASRNVNVISDMLLFFELLRLFRKERPGVIHLNSSKVGGLGALAGRLLVTGYWLLGLIKKILARLFRKPVTSYQLPVTIFTVHGFAFAEERPFFARLVMRFLSWLTVALSSNTILITKAEYEKVRRWPFAGHKAVLIPNGIAPIAFLDKATAREKLSPHIEQKDTSPANAYRLTPNAFLIGSVAELHKNKGLEYLVEAIHVLSTLHLLPSTLKLLIIGEGEERSALEILIKKHRLEDTVFLAGFIENAASYLKAFDVFVLSSLKEGLPYVLLEAGMAQLPSIATNVGGVPDILEHEKTALLVPTGDQETLALALSSLLKDSEKASRLGKNAGETIASLFTAENMLKKTASLYRMCYTGTITD